MTEQTVDFERHGDSRSSSAFGRTVVADALAPIDPVGARAAQAETAWRSGYLPHFRRLTEAAIGDAEGARRSAEAGLEAVRRHMVWTPTETPLSDLEWDAAAPDTSVITGAGSPRDLAIPYRGRDLRGAELEWQLDAWVQAGTMEPSVADSVRLVAAHPEWLALDGRILVALGAGSEMGPVSTLLGWGATVAGVDLPGEDRWRRLLDQAGRSAGRFLHPHRDGVPGLDLLGDPQATAAWIDALPDADLVLGNYVYADGGLNLRLSAATDALAREVQQRRDAALAFMATPTDVFAVPADAVAHSVRACESRSRTSRIGGRMLRGASAGRLLKRAYLPGADPGTCDALVPQQGPNYALGKRIHRWRAVTERVEGRAVSMNVAPPTRTRSVVKNRALAAAYAGAHRFGVEVFEPETTRVLMAALLVRDLMDPAPAAAEPWLDEAYDAVHGGLWRAAFAPRSALGLAAVLGVGAR